MFKLQVCTRSGDELGRMLDSADVTHICSTLSLLVQDISSRRGEDVHKIVVHECAGSGVLAYQAPSVTNICGKITHHAVSSVHAPGVRVYVKRHRNNFGVFHSVFTTACNFNTGSNKTSTLFRAGSCSAAIGDAVQHVFVQDAVHEVLVNNVVYSARLGHPVCKRNDGIRRALQALQAGRVTLCMPMEECMFVHCFTVLVDEEWLRGHGVVGVEAMRVRINLCRTGVVNFFFGVTGGLPLLSEPEARLRPVCLALWHAVLQAV